MSQESDKPVWSLTETTHRALGALLVLSIGPSLRLRLTPTEAHTLALAMFAVRDGRSPERELFMCPIASDAIFVAPVGVEGIAVETPAGPQRLDWSAVGALAGALSPAAIPA